VKNWKRFFASAVLGCGVANSSGVLHGQEVLERDTTITGPRGRSIQRQVEVQRSPGMIDRSVQIKRPGSTFDRQVQIQRSPLPGRGFIPGPWPRPAWFGPRPLVIAQPAPAFGFGLMAAPFMNFSIGGGGGGFGGGGMPGGPGAPPPPPPDQVALMCQRLQGFHLTGRKEAAYTLGQLGDPRAVPTLVHVLKYDNFKDVRVAAAIALGEIGGSESAVALERAAVYDHREDVKKAASTALERLNAKAKAVAAMPQPIDDQPSVRRRLSAPATTSPSPFREVPPLGGPTPAAGDASPSQGELTPPPPPTPVTSSPGGSGNS
jgi:HEAT repeats